VSELLQYAPWFAWALVIVLVFANRLRVDEHADTMAAMQIMIDELRRSNEFLHGAIDELMEEADDDAG